MKVVDLRSDNEMAAGNVTVTIVISNGQIGSSMVKLGTKEIGRSDIDNLKVRSGPTLMGNTRLWPDNVQQLWAASRDVGLSASTGTTIHAGAVLGTAPQNDWDWSRAMFDWADSLPNCDRGPYRLLSTSGGMT